MNKELKILLITLGVSLGLLWILKPKKTSQDKSETSTSDTKYAAPKIANEDLKKLKENAIIGMQAMRDAINGGESAANLTKLADLIFADYGVKVIVNKTSGKLKAMAKNGALIAEEIK